MNELFYSNTMCAYKSYSRSSTCPKCPRTILHQINDFFCLMKRTLWPILLIGLSDKRYFTSARRPSETDVIPYLSTD